MGGKKREGERLFGEEEKKERKKNGGKEEGRGEVVW